MSQMREYPTRLPAGPTPRSIVRMIHIAQGNGAHGSQPLGIIRHVRVILAVSHNTWSAA